MNSNKSSDTPVTDAVLGPLWARQASNVTLQELLAITSSHLQLERILAGAVKALEQAAEQGAALDWTDRNSVFHYATTRKAESRALVNQLSEQMLKCAEPPRIALGYAPAKPDGHGEKIRMLTKRVRLLERKLRGNQTTK